MQSRHGENSLLGVRASWARLPCLLGCCTGYRDRHGDLRSFQNHTRFGDFQGLPNHTQQQAGEEPAGSVLRPQTRQKAFRFAWIPCSSPGWCLLGSRTGWHIMGSAPNQFMNLQGNRTGNLNNAMQGHKSCFVPHCKLKAEVLPPSVGLKTTQSQVTPAGNTGSPALTALGQDPDTTAPKHYRYLGLNLHFHSRTMKNGMKNTQQNPNHPICETSS